MIDPKVTGWAVSNCSIWETLLVKIIVIAIININIARIPKKYKETKTAGIELCQKILHDCPKL